MSSKRKPSKSQIAALRALGYPFTPVTSADAADAIVNLRSAAAKGKGRPPLPPPGTDPTPRQLSYLRSLGYSGEIPATRKEASALIGQHQRLRRADTDEWTPNTGRYGAPGIG
jgi:hypothetical protein